MSEWRIDLRRIHRLDSGMHLKPYDPFDPGIYLDFAGTEDFQRFMIGNWKMKLWWSGGRWVKDRSKARLFGDFIEARELAWHIRVNCLRFPEQ